MTVAALSFPPTAPANDNWAVNDWEPTMIARVSGKGSI